MPASAVAGQITLIAGLRGPTHSMPPNQAVRLSCTNALSATGRLVVLVTARVNAPVVTGLRSR